MTDQMPGEQARSARRASEGRPEAYELRDKTSGQLWGGSPKRQRGKDVRPTLADASGCPAGFVPEPYGLLMPTKLPSCSRASAHRNAPTSGLS
jgi:hypothetical protein